MEQQEGTFIGNYACIDCPSSDAMGVYKKDDGSFNGYCRGTGCEDAERYKGNNQLAESDIGGKLGITKIKRQLKVRSKGASQRKTTTTSPTKKEEKSSIITEEEREEVKSNTSVKGGGYRGIKDKYNKLLGIRTGYDETTGEVSERYYPVTKGKDNEDKPILVDYKIRFESPKDFRPLKAGRNSKTCDMFGQWRCKGSGKYILIVGGEEDTAAALQMLTEDQIRRGKSHLPMIDVVCSSIGETSAAAQCKYHYDFFDGYDNIIVDMDEDNAGCKAAQALLDALPMGKVRVLENVAKDACENIKQGLEKEYVSAFYDAKKPKLAGIHGGIELLEDMYQESSFKKLPLPPFMAQLNDMLEGGYDFGTFNIIAGDTSIGKSTLVNEIASHIIETKEHKPVILSLEARKGVLTRQYLSLKLGKRLGEFHSPEEMKAYVEEHKEEVNDFLTTKEGDNTYEVIDDRARLLHVEDTFNMIEKAIRGLGCDTLIIDPYTDLVDSLTIEEQAAFNARIKALIAAHNICIIAVCHTKKLEGRDKDGNLRIEPTRHDVYGSKTTIASATTLLLIWRDLQHEDPDMRNTTFAKLDKNRDHSITGPAGEYLYKRNIHRLVMKKKGGF